MCEINGFEALIIISIVSAIVWNLLTKNYVLAFLGSWVSSVIGLQVGNIICIGYLDPFFLIAMVISSVPALFISAVVSSPFMMFRYRQEEKEGQKKNVQH